MPSQTRSQRGSKAESPGEPCDATVAPILDFAALSAKLAAAGPTGTGAPKKSHKKKAVAPESPVPVAPELRIAPGVAPKKPHVAPGALKKPQEPGAPESPVAPKKPEVAPKALRAVPQPVAPRKQQTKKAVAPVPQPVARQCRSRSHK